jgi:hypothetical protein
MPRSGNELDRRGLRFLIATASLMAENFNSAGSESFLNLHPTRTNTHWEQSAGATAACYLAFQFFEFSTSENPYDAMQHLRTWSVPNPPPYCILRDQRNPKFLKRNRDLVSHFGTRA